MSDAKRVFACGRSGSGKSSIMDEIAAPSRRLIVCDYLDGDGALRRQRRLKLTHATSLAQVRALIARGYASGFRIWYQPPIDDQVEALHQLAGLIWNIQNRAKAVTGKMELMTLYVDELSDGFPNYALPSNKRGYYRLCKAGRHYRVNMLAASQRPAQVNTEFRGNLDACYLFSLVGEADHKAARALGGVRVEQFVKTAPRFHYARMGEGGDVTFGQTRR